MNHTEFSKLKAFIREKTGLTLTSSHVSLMEQEIIRRMDKKNIASWNEYIDFLALDEDELNLFIGHLTINETYFFREPAYIQLFTRCLAPEFTDTSVFSGPRLKVLSAGCSTGEEPYSLMMALMEQYGSRVKKAVKIRGIDIDARAIEKAALGVYSGHSFRNMDERIRQRYFDRMGRDRFRLKEEVKKEIRLETVNLLDLPYPADLAGMDIIFYRNVSIYFDKKNRRKIFEQMASLLKPGGYLIVGSAETLPHHYEVLSLVEMDGVFLFRKPESSGMQKPEPMSGTGAQDTGKKQGASPAAVLSSSFQAGEEPAVTAPKKSPELSIKPFFRPGSSVKEASPDKSPGSGIKPTPEKPAETSLPSPEEVYHEALGLAERKMYAKSLAVLEQQGDADTQDLPCRLLKATILINLKRSEEAERICRQAVDADSLLPEGHLLLGIIAKLNRDNDTAVKSFKTALYLSSSNWMARYYLAEIYQQESEKMQAVREYRNVIRLLEKGHFHDHGLAFFPFSFSEASVKHLCRHHIRVLEDEPTASAGNRVQGRA